MPKALSSACRTLGMIGVNNCPYPWKFRQAGMADVDTIDKVAKDTAKTETDIIGTTLFGYGAKNNHLTINLRKTSNYSQKTTGYIC